MADRQHFFCASTVRQQPNCGFVDQVWAQVLPPIAQVKSDLRSFASGFKVDAEPRLARDDFTAAIFSPRAPNDLGKAFLLAFDRDGNGRLEGQEEVDARASAHLEADQLFGSSREVGYDGFEFWLQVSGPEKLAASLRDNLERERERKAADARMEQAFPTR